MLANSMGAHYSLRPSGLTLTGTDAASDPAPPLQVGRGPSSPGPRASWTHDPGRRTPPDPARAPGRQHQPAPAGRVAPAPVGPPRRAGPARDRRGGPLLPAARPRPRR